MDNKNTLIFIQSTDGNVSQFIDKGFWSRQHSYLAFLSNEFNVIYYTFDKSGYKAEMPGGVIHKNPRLTGLYGIDHLIYYLYLISSAFSWRRFSVIRIWGTSLPVVGILKRVCALPIVVSFQYDWAEGVKLDYRGIKTFFSRVVQNNCIKSSDVIFSTTKRLVEKAVVDYKKENVQLVPNFVDTSLFKPLDKTNSIVFAGRLHWSKGIVSLIDAFLKFKQTHEDWELIILGGGPLFDELKTKHSETKEIQFMGSVKHKTVAEIFNRSRIFVLPTLTREGHPKALIEALAAGCSCLASNVDGNNDVLNELGLDEYLFIPGNSDDLCIKLNKVLDKGLQDKSQLVNEKYSIESIVSKEVDIYMKLCQKN